MPLTIDVYKNMNKEVSVSTRGHNEGVSVQFSEAGYYEPLSEKPHTSLVINLSMSQAFSLAQGLKDLGISR